jgi:pectinesterase
MPPTNSKLVLVLLIATFIDGATPGGDTVPFYPSAEAAATAHCDRTLYTDLCLSTLADIADLHKKPLPDVIAATVNRTESVVTATASNCSYYLRDTSLTARDRLAISDCMELLSTTMDELEATMADLESPGANGSAASQAAERLTEDHVMTVLSAAMTNLYTCLDGLAYQQKGSKVLKFVEPALHHVSRMVSNSLAMAKKLPGGAAASSSAAARPPFMGYGQMVDGFPKWVRPGDRRLLQAPASGIAPDAVVAKDGSGQYTTVSAAVAAAPSNSKKRHVIYIKAGEYMENVEVGKKHTNLMFVGDGIGKTVIKASRNVVDGSTTFRSATIGKYLLSTVLITVRLLGVGGHGNCLHLHSSMQWFEVHATPPLRIKWYESGA